MTTHCAVDFHARSQTIRFVSDGDGEIHARRLDHTCDDVRAFYASLPAPATVYLEAHGYTAWFEALLSDLGIRFLIGDPARIARFRGRKHKNDDKDADLLLELALAGRFPAIYRPGPDSRRVLQLLRFRHNLVRTRTRVANSLAAIALSGGAKRKPRVLTRAGRELVRTLPMSETLAWQRDQWLELLDGLEPLVREVERRLEGEAASDERVRRLRTHPGVGLLTGLAVVHVLGPAERFATGRKVTAYAGLDPVEDSSGERRRYGQISKQGSKLLRFLLVEAGQAAVKEDEQLRGVYSRIKHRKNHPIAKVAVARRLLVRCWIMQRDRIDYDEFCRRGRKAVVSQRAGRPVETHRLR